MLATEDAALLQDMMLLAAVNNTANLLLTKLLSNNMLLTKLLPKDMLLAVRLLPKDAMLLPNDAVSSCYMMRLLDDAATCC